MHQETFQELLKKFQLYKKPPTVAQELQPKLPIPNNKPFYLITTISRFSKKITFITS